MRVVMLLSKSYRQDARVQKEARVLHGAGHHVTVVEWARHDPSALAAETIDGVDVVRLDPARPLRPLGPVAGNPFWWRAAARAGRRLHAGQPIDVVHAHDLDTLPAGVRIKRATGARLVFDAHEIFSIMVRHDKGRIVSRAADRLEQRLLPHVDQVVTVNDALAAHYRKRTASPVEVVMNCADPPPKTRPPPKGPFTVVYIGLLSPARFFPDAVHAIGEMNDVRFVIAGKQEGNWQAVAEAAEDYENVEFLGTIPAGEVLDTMAAGHAILCPLDPRDPQYRVATATKVLDAMAVARPSIATEGTYTGDLVREHDSGLVVPYTRDGLVDAVQRLRDDAQLAKRLGDNGRRAALETLNWTTQAEHLRAVYARLEDD